MIITSWNVNSVRARLDNIKDYLNKFSPDIVMMQEIKTQDETFPYDDFSSLDYESHVFGQKSYNGVAIISKQKLENIRLDLIKDKLKQSRIISAEFKHKKKNIQIINIYTPNGNPVDTDKYTYKKEWLDNLIKQLKTLSKKNANIILGGDFNIIPSAEDVYNVKSFENDALYRLEIRKKLREMINLGFHDAYRHVHNDKEGFTFWDYMRGAWQKNNGMRIDHFLVSNSLLNIVKNVNINKEPRGKEKPSDHTPIEIELA
jgi:exodeoxyribonuclease-3